jgi:hypothetical protein
MRPVKELADTVRQHRRPVAADNPFLAIERAFSDQVERALDGYRDLRDRTTERVFSGIYRSPWLQAMVGLRSATAEAPKARPRDEVFETLLAQKIAALRARMGDGGFREGAVRMLLYAGGDEVRVDVRGFRMAERIRDEYLAGGRLAGPQRRELFKEQFFMLLLDEERALATLPQLLPRDQDRSAALELVTRVLSAKGELSPERRARLARLSAILGAPAAARAQVA